MHQNTEFFGLRLSRQQCDSAAVRHAECGGNAFVVFKRDALRLHEVLASGPDRLRLLQ